MAIQTERMVAILEARLDKYEKGLARAYGTTNRQFSRIEKRGKQMESRISALGGSIARTFTAGLAGFASAASLRGAQQLIDASTRIQNALKVAGLEGSELTRVYDRLFESAQRNAAPLESLVTLYGRAALVQKELGITTEELLGFTDKVALALRVSGQSAAESSGALLQLSQALGSGIVRAEEFNSILEGALPIAQAAAAGLEEAGGSVAKLRQLIVDGAVSSEAFFRAFEAGSVILQEKVAGAELTVSQGFIRLTNVLIRVAGEFNEATGISQGTASALESLALAIEQLGDFAVRVANGPIGTFIGKLSALNDVAKTALETMARFSLVDEGIAALGSFVAPEGTGPADPRIAGGKQGAVQGPIDRRIDAAFVASSGGTVSLKDFAAPASAAAGGAAKAVKDTFKAARDGFAEMIGATEEWRRQQDLANQQLEDFSNIAQSAGSALANALSDGKLEAGELLQILGQVASQLAQMALAGGGGIGGGFLSGILGSIFHQGGVVGSGGPKRRVHPGVFAGAPRYHSGGVAGLKPGEVPAILQRGEVVLPKGAGARQAGPQQITITLVGEEGEMFTPRVQQISGQTAGIVVRESRPQLSRDAVNSVQQASRNRPGIFR